MHRTQPTALAPARTRAHDGCLGRVSRIILCQRKKHSLSIGRLRCSSKYWRASLLCGSRTVSSLSLRKHTRPPTCFHCFRPFLSVLAGSPLTLFAILSLCFAKPKDLASAPIIFGVSLHWQEEQEAPSHSQHIRPHTEKVYIRNCFPVFNRSS